jgi:hypothetical protein
MKVNVLRRPSLGALHGTRAGPGQILVAHLLLLRECQAGPRPHQGWRRMSPAGDTRWTVPTDCTARTPEELQRLVAARTVRCMVASAETRVFRGLLRN